MRGEGTLYSKLGVDPSATAEEVHLAYAKLTEKLLAQPVESASSVTQVTEDETLFKELTKAYRILIDAESRKEYDRSLQQQPHVQLVVHAEVVAEHQPIARYQEVVLPQQEPSEEWAKERQYFEEHFDEILKPAPKVNLVATGGGETAVDAALALSATSSATTGEVREEAGARFGTLPTEHEIASLTALKHARRPIALGGTGSSFDLLLLLGLPFLAILVAVEYYFLTQ